MQEGLPAFHCRSTGNPAALQRRTVPALSDFPFQMLPPVDADGAVQPPAGAPGIFIRHKDSEAHGSPGAADTVELFEFHVDFVTPANTTLTGPIQVYALIKAKRIPATRVTGKWIFPKKLIDDWIETNAKSGMVEARKKGKRIEGALLAAGSNDPILDILNTFIKQSHPELFIFSANVGSTDGLKALNQGYTDLAWSHLLDPKSGEYNTPFLATYLPNLKPVVVNLFYRELGSWWLRGIRFTSGASKT